MDVMIEIVGLLEMEDAVLRGILIEGGIHIIYTLEETRVELIDSPAAWCGGFRLLCSQFGFGETREGCDGVRDGLSSALLSALLRRKKL